MKLDEAFRSHGAIDVICEPCGEWVGMFNLRRYTAEAAAMLPPGSSTIGEMENAIQHIKTTLGESAYVPIASLVDEITPFPCPKCGARFQLVRVHNGLTLKRIAPSN